MTREELIDYIKDGIIREELKPGRRLVENELCKMLDASRGRVREALMHLAQEGFVEIVKYKGAVVKGLSQTDISQNNDIVGVLEGLAARIAIQSISEIQIGHIEKIIKEIKDNQDDYLKVFHLNDQFHRLLTSMSENEKLINLLDGLYGHISRSSLQGFYHVDQIRATIQEHDSILAAIRDRDELKVENLIREHYLSSKNRLLRLVNHSL
ncbi:MAG: GntR family transcriptional regulator [Proteobacteria bacterium]|nr:GntR family transcriptional regulator [Pseudomonadota bacterium]